MIGGINTTYTAQKPQKKDDTPSTGRMMLRYGLAVPSVYELGGLVTTYVKMEKTEPTFWKNINKAFEKYGMHFNLKTLGVLTLAGVGVGIAMKKLIDTHPDNKILKTINTVASWIGC